MIDLKPFCSREVGREYLRQPFSFGEWTYATNGYVMVRVPRRDDVPENDKVPKLATFEDYPAFDMRPLPIFDLPVGRGTIEKACSVGLAGVPFAKEYIVLLRSLPNVTIPKQPHTANPMPFTFDGGQGLLMPRRSPAAIHVDEPTL